MTYVLFFIGILATLASMVLLGQSRPLRGGVITTGTVVDTQQETSTIRGSGPRRRMTTYAPVIEFTDAIGKTHQITPSISGGTPPVIGSTRQISYLPADPDRAHILANTTTWIPIVLFLVVGLGFLIAAVALR